MGIDYKKLREILERKANKAINHLDELKCFVPEFRDVLDSVLYISETLKDLMFLDTECPDCKKEELDDVVEEYDFIGKPYTSFLTDSNEPRFVLFYSDHCGPCIYLKPILEKFAQFKKIPVEMILVDSTEGEAHALAHGIKSWPTLFAVEDNIIQNFKIGADMNAGEEDTIRSIEMHFLKFLSKHFSGMEDN